MTEYLSTEGNLCSLTILSKWDTFSIKVPIIWPIFTLGMCLCCPQRKITRFETRPHVSAQKVAERASLPDRNFACQLCVWCLRKELVSCRFHLKSQIGLCIIDGVWFSQLRWNRLFNGWRHSWSSAACLGQRFILSDHFLIHTHLAVNLELELWFIILFYFATANLTHYHN